VARTGYRSELAKSGSSGEVNREVVPFSIDGVHLLLSQSRKGRERSFFGALQIYERNVCPRGR